jgi:hypothetical protein
MLDVRRGNGYHKGWDTIRLKCGESALLEACWTGSVKQDRDLVGNSLLLCIYMLWSQSDLWTIADRGRRVWM